MLSYVFVGFFCIERVNRRQWRYRSEKGFGRAMKIAAISSMAERTTPLNHARMALCVVCQCEWMKMKGKKLLFSVPYFMFRTLLVTSLYGSSYIIK